MKELVLNNWIAKVAALFVAVSVWYLVKSGADKPIIFPVTTPVPGEKPEVTEEDKAAQEKLNKLTSPVTELDDPPLTSPVPGPDTTTPVPNGGQ